MKAGKTGDVPKVKARSHTEVDPVSNVSALSSGKAELTWGTTPLKVLCVSRLGWCDQHTCYFPNTIF